jgi:hypothetical protein
MSRTNIYGDYVFIQTIQGFYSPSITTLVYLDYIFTQIKEIKNHYRDNVFTL